MMRAEESWGSGHGVLGSVAASLGNERGTVLKSPDPSNTDASDCSICPLA
jgi:hypothetical protein